PFAARSTLQQGSLLTEKFHSRHIVHSIALVGRCRTGQSNTAALVGPQYSVICLISNARTPASRSTIRPAQILWDLPSSIMERLSRSLSIFRAFDQETTIGHKVIRSQRPAPI